MNRKRITLITILLIAITIIIVSVWVVNRTSLESRIAALDAQRYVPDANNAALPYTRYILLASDRRIALELCDKIPSLPVHEMDSAVANDITFLVNNPNINKSQIVFTESQPWQKSDAPYMADWLDQRQKIFQGLSEASKKLGCFFPMIQSPDRISILDIPWAGPFRKLASVLRRAAYYDLGEGRIHEAIDKIETIIRMAHHLQQQPTEAYLLVGCFSLELRGIEMMADIIINGSILAEDLDTFDALYMQPQIDLSERRKETGLGTAWRQRHAANTISWRQQFQMKWQDLFGDRFLDLPFTPVSAGLADLDSKRHAQRILVALRRYRNRTGQWPESLNSIASDLPREVFIDPQCDMPYVYQLTETGFRLYSKGANGRDDNGKRTRKKGPDDIVIWQTGDN